MSEKIRQTVAQKFRDEATDEQWKKMVEDHDILSPEDFKTEYKFTWSAIMNDAVNRGLYTKKKQMSINSSKTETGNKSKVTFIVKDRAKDSTKKQRSIELYEDIETRLKQLRDDKCQYTFASIINQLLDDALEKYGY